MMVDEMTRLAELGEALSPDEIPMDRLRAGAMTVTRPPRNWIRPIAVASAVAASAAGAIVMAGAGGPPESPHRDPTRPASYAVTKNADGTVTFTVHELRDLAGATRALNDAGIAGRVLVSTEGCTAGLNHADLVSVDFTGELTGDDTVVVSSSEYPPGGGVLIAVVGDVPDNPSVVEVAFVDRNKIPSCVDLTVYGRTTSTR